MTTKSTLPGSWDEEFILAKMVEAGVDNHIGSGRPDENTLEIVYPASGHAAVLQIIEDYPTQYADEVLRPKLKAEVTQTRWEKQVQPTTFMGMPVETDDVTIGRITAAAYLMDADPTSPQAREWKVAEGVWVTLDRNTLVAMGGAIATHIQACFANEKALHEALDAAPTVDDIDLIDLTAGWPV